MIDFTIPFYLMFISYILNILIANIVSLFVQTYFFLFSNAHFSGLCICCFLKERKCVVCDRAVIGWVSCGNLNGFANLRFCISQLTTDQRLSDCTVIGWNFSCKPQFWVVSLILFFRLVNFNSVLIDNNAFCHL